MKTSNGNHRSRNYSRCVGWALCLGIALISPFQAHATLVAGVSSCCGSSNVTSAPIVPKSDNTEAEKHYENVKRREKAISIMITLGYSQNDAQAFVHVLMLAGVIQ